MSQYAGISERIHLFNKVLLPEKVLIKYKMMSLDAFRFFRGTCHIFYEDLFKSNFNFESPKVWMCGDLHLENFGSFKGDNRLVYFDLNDFDESIIGNAYWELLRMVTSIFVAFESLEIEDDLAMKWAVIFLKNYQQELRKGKPVYIEPRTASGIVKTFLEKVSQRKPNSILKKHIRIKKKKYSFIIDSQRHFNVSGTLKTNLLGHMSEWIKTNGKSFANYDPVDVSFRIAGTGSIGLKRYLFLLHNKKKNKKYLLLDMKQSRASSLLPYVKENQPEFSSEAERVIEVQYRMQNVSPALLSTTVFENESYIIKEMQPIEDKIDFELIKNRYDDVCNVINDMALLIASAQLRSSGRNGSATSDELIAFGRYNEMQDHILDYAKNYAKKVKDDYLLFKNDLGKGFPKI